MRKALRRGLLLLCAVSVLAVPAVANGRQLGDLYRLRLRREPRRPPEPAGGRADHRRPAGPVRRRHPPADQDIGKVKNLAGDQSLVGIDYRVQDGKLYGVGNAGGIYTLGAGDARATKVGQLTVALSGTSFGVDFNPAANRLRVVSNTGQNLRHNLDDATATAPPLAGMTVMDGTLTVPPATTPVMGVAGAAYTNNDLDPNTATTLFDLDTAADRSWSSRRPTPARSPPPASCWSTPGPSPGSTSTAATPSGPPSPTTASPASRCSAATASTRSACSPAGPASIGSFRPSAQVADIAIPLDQG